jgi:hypothetical protein
MNGLGTNIMQHSYKSFNKTAFSLLECGIKDEKDE